MPAAPRVTVLMTLYNKGPYVEEAIRSVLAQTFTDFELLVVDDASTDGGLEKVKAIQDHRIRILETHVNGGRARAANRGYDAATGEYVAVLDADDIMVPERLARQVAFLDGSPEVVAVGSWAQAFGAAHHLIPFPESDPGARGQMLFGIPVLYGTAMMRRNILEAHSVRCLPHWKYPGMDRLFILEVGKHGKYASIPEALIRYRVGAQNMRHGRNAVDDMHHLYRAVFNLLGFTVSNREIELQTFLHDLGGTPPTAAQVIALHRWMGKLKAMNRKRRILPVTEFEAELERRWGWLFHRATARSALAGLAHAACSGTLASRLGYVAKVTKDRWLGRTPKDLPIGS